MARRTIDDNTVKLCEDLLALNKYTQSEIAKKLGIGNATVSDIKNGKHRSQLKANAEVKEESDRSYVKQLIPNTEDERYFDVKSDISMIGIQLNSHAQQMDEIIDLLIRQNSLLAELVELWKPEEKKAC